MSRRQPFETDAQLRPEPHADKTSAQQAAKHAHHGIAIQALATGLVRALVPGQGGTEADHADARADNTVQGAPETSQVQPSFLTTRDTSTATMQRTCDASIVIVVINDC